MFLDPRRLRTNINFKPKPTLRSTLETISIKCGFFIALTVVSLYYQTYFFGKIVHRMLCVWDAVGALSSFLFPTAILL